MANPEELIFEQTFEPLADSLVPPEQHDIFMEQITAISRRQIGLRLLERYPTEQRQEILTRVANGQGEKLYDQLVNQIDTAQLQQLVNEEVASLVAGIIKEAVPHMDEGQVFKLRHELSQNG